MEPSSEELKKVCKEGCGCHCHAHGCGNNAGHCCSGFWKGLIVGMVLFALLVFLCDRLCEHRMAWGYNNSPSMTQNAEPDAHMRNR